MTSTSQTDRKNTLIDQDVDLLLVEDLHAAGTVIGLITGGLVIGIRL